MGRISETVEEQRAHLVEAEDWLAKVVAALNINSDAAFQLIETIADVQEALQLTAVGAKKAKEFEKEMRGKAESKALARELLEETNILLGRE